MAMGRPSKYTEEIGEEARKQLAKGFTIRATCGLIGIAPDTLYNWIKKYPNFSELVTLGQAQGQAKFEKILMAKISGQRIKDFDPKKCSDPLLMLALKSRFPKDFGEKQTVDFQDKSLVLNIINETKKASNDSED